MIVYTRYSDDGQMKNSAHKITFSKRINCANIAAVKQQWTKQKYESDTGSIKKTQKQKYEGYLKM